MSNEPVEIREETEPELTRAQQLYLRNSALPKTPNEIYREQQQLLNDEALWQKRYYIYPAESAEARARMAAEARVRKMRRAK